MPGKLGCMGVGGGCKRRWLERREKARIGLAWGNGMGGMEEGWIWEQGCKYLKGAILGFARDLSLEGFSGPRRGPHIVPWAAEKRVPELTLAHSHTDEYLVYHHKTFIWRWMEIETETHIGAQDLAPKVQMSRRRENMKEVRIMRDASTH